MSRGVDRVRGVLAAGLTAMLLAPVGIAAQAAPRSATPATAAKAGARAGAWTAPRTPDGRPDLQGTWNISTMTPLERRLDQADKATLTAQEAAAAEQQGAERRARSSAPSRQDRVAPPAGGAFGGNIFWAEPGTTFATINGQKRTSLIVDPPDGRIPFVPDARVLQDRIWTERGVGPYNSYADFDTGERCITDGIPWTPFAYNDNFQIVQTPVHLAIYHELFAEWRVIPIDGRPHSASAPPQWKGESRGRWDGGTLVVDTIHFADKAHYQWPDIWRAARPTLHVVERFTRVAANQIDYEFTVEDPTMFTRSWTATVPMTRTDLRIFEYACHEGNVGVEHSLRAARFLEAEAAAKTVPR